MTLTAQQIEVRRTRIGGSEIGALLGISPHRSALDVFASKVLPSRVEESQPHLVWGHDVERAILVSHARSQCLRIEEPGTLLHPKHSAICATPDGIGVRENGSRVVLEVKNSQWHQSHRWGEPGSDDAPLLYVAQVQMELGIALAQMGVETIADLVASIGGAPPVAYRIPFDPELFGQLVQVAEKFVRDHIQTGRPPDGWETDPGAAEYLARRFERNDGRLLPADDEIRSLAASVASMRATAKACVEEKEAAEVRLKNAIGDADGFEGVCTWKRSKDTTAAVTDWQAVAQEAHVPEDLIKKHTRLAVTRQGSRRLLLSKEK